MQPKNPRWEWFRQEETSGLAMCRGESGGKKEKKTKRKKKGTLRIVREKEG